MKWSCLLPLLPSVAVALTVEVTSPQAGLLFEDGEPRQLTVQVAAAAGPVRVEWQVSETEGPWQASGQLLVPVAAGRGQAGLPLEVPGRGHFPLRLVATDGPATARLETAVSVVFVARPTDPESAWGLFYTPRRWIQPPYTGDDAAAAARSHRLLGASWSRLNLWEHSFGAITMGQRDGQPDVRGDWGEWKRYARTLRAEGISILGEIAQCPRALSSQPAAGDTRGDAGPRWCRVKPRDWAQWESLIENLARDFRDEIDYWEIWNEANLDGVYWAGTPAELVELVAHTSAALRRGNPRAKILGCGFVHGHDYVDRVLAMGLGRHLDILSVHYTDERPGETAAWRQVLAKHQLNLPLWNTEERSEVPLQNLADGIERNFKFMHLHVGYDDYRLLCNADYTCRPQALWQATGAHFLAGAQFVAVSAPIAGRRLCTFRRPGQEVAVLAGNPMRGLFATTPAMARVRVGGAGPLEVTNRVGRSRQVPVVAGRAEVPLDSPLLYLTGATGMVLEEISNPGGGLVAEAEDGRCSEGWGRHERPGFSGGKILELWSTTAPGPAGYWAEVTIEVPRAGRYEVIFAGNSLGRLKPPRSLSPLAWSCDGGPETICDDALPLLTDVTAVPEALAVLGQLALAAGPHTFRLRLTAPRDTPDQAWALWFDALALREIAP
ncbi:MAG: hypothetical protein IT204_04090 [Fimbriimonadaceae bacterium]|nr:hypothetical protein [Fimbriimonadaceae bacterium]